MTDSLPQIGLDYRRAVSIPLKALQNITVS